MSAQPHENQSYNPKSFDAVLARLELMQETSRADMAELRTMFSNQGDRISSLERDKWFQRGVVASISAGVSAFFAWITTRSS